MDAVDNAELKTWISRIASTLRRHGYAAVVVDPRDAGTTTEAAITFPYNGVVVRDHTEWPDGVGCCLYDARKNQIKPILLLVRPDDKAAGAVTIAKRTVDGNVPPIAVWVLTVSDATLDMGDGRTITVGD